jgi:hypothetical protein
VCHTFSFSSKFTVSKEIRETHLYRTEDEEGQPASTDDISDDARIVGEKDNNAETGPGNSGGIDNDDNNDETTTVKGQSHVEEEGNGENTTERKKEEEREEKEMEGDSNVSMRRTDAQEETSEDPELLAALRELKTKINPEIGNSIQTDSSPREFKKTR